MRRGLSKNPFWELGLRSPSLRPAGWEFFGFAEIIPTRAETNGGRGSEGSPFSVPERKAMGNICCNFKLESL